MQFLHVVFVATMTPSSMPPRVATIRITAAIHPVAIAILAAVRPVAVIVLSGSAGQCQTADTENQQQTNNYDPL
jgi:hypothetical protein